MALNERCLHAMTNVRGEELWKRSFYRHEAGGLQQPSRWSQWAQQVRVFIRICILGNIFPACNIDEIF